MLEYSDIVPNKKIFGKLELIDKEIFYISFNTRDN
jgi:hypothetical protein